MNWHNLTELYLTYLFTISYCSIDIVISTVNVVNFFNHLTYEKTYIYPNYFPSLSSGLRSFLNRQTNKHSIYSNSIHTPSLSLNNNINECRIPLLENGCMLNGKKNVIGDKVLPSDDINNSTDRHLDSLLHEAWEEIWAKHQHSPVKTTFANGQSDSLENGNLHHYHQDNCKLDTEDVYSSDSIVTTKANNDADFRCIAVEINEEKFGLLSPVTVPTCTVNENKKYSISSLSKLNTDSLNCVNNSGKYDYIY